MAGRDDDDFRPKPGRIRNGGRSKSYLGRVLREMERTGDAGAGRRQGGRFTGRRIGRGNDVMRRFAVGRGLGRIARRVVIKSRIVKLTGGNGGLSAARAHIKYIQRDGVSQERDAGQLYDARGDDVDGRTFLKRSESDRHQFRFIVAPEDASELDELKPFVRDLMRTMESDLGTRLDWVAVDHFNTGHPHTHIVLRGRDDQGKDLVIARDYISHGMRRRASELLTVELGPQTEQEIRQKLERQVGQERFTDLDRKLVRQAEGGLLDMRRGSPTGEVRSRQAPQVARLRVLERRGLAVETAPGQWRLSPNLEPTLQRAGERGDIIKTMHRSLKAAGLDIGATDYAIFDTADGREQKVVGRILDRGLHDALNDGHFILIDAADGRVHYVALDPRQDMDDLPMGAVVEVEPAARGIRNADRTIAEVACRNGGIYAPQLHLAYDGSASDEFVKAHVRRLEALRRLNLVRRSGDGTWQVPEDFEDRVAGAARAQSRYPARVLTLSHLSLEHQVTAEGATWLDRQLVGSGVVALRGERFGGAAKAALVQRQEHLIGQGLAAYGEGGVRYRRNLLAQLRRRDIAAAGERLAKETGMAFVETPDGARAEGVYRRSVQLSSGKFAVLEKSKEFTLVPWRPVLERAQGKTISGVARGATVSFDVTRRKGMGIG